MVFSLVVNVTVLSILQSLINLLSKLLVETENLTILASHITFPAVVQISYDKMWHFFKLVIP